MKAIDAIQDAYERCNRLSPGESLSPDDAAFAFRRLNLLVDELSAHPQFLFQSLLTSAPQTGPITLGAGAWAAVPPGANIVSATANGFAMAPITMQQYNEIIQPEIIGQPSLFAQDGMSTVYLWPVSSGQTIQILTQGTVAAFADQLTDYTVPPGYETALGAALAVRVAPTLLGGIPPYLVQEERRAMDAITSYEPAIVDVLSFDKDCFVYRARLFS